MNSNDDESNEFIEFFNKPNNNFKDIDSRFEEKKFKIIHIRTHSRPNNLVYLDQSKQTSNEWIQIVFFLVGKKIDR